jgi:hypothetical protein
MDILHINEQKIKLHSKQIYDRKYFGKKNQNKKKHKSKTKTI